MNRQVQNPRKELTNKVKHDHYEIQQELKCYRAKRRERQLIGSTFDCKPEPKWINMSGAMNGRNQWENYISHPVFNHPSCFLPFQVHI